MHSDQFKPKSCVKLIKKYIFSEGQQFSLKELSHTLFRGAVALLVPESICGKMRENAKFDLWWPMVTWPLTWPKKWHKQFRHDFLCFFECCLPRVATCPSNRVRWGGGSNTSARRVRRQAPAWRGLISASLIIEALLYYILGMYLLFMFLAGRLPIMLLNAGWCCWHHLIITEGAATSRLLDHSITLIAG